MENASKALIIAAEVLIGVLLLTLMVFLFHSMGTFSDTVDKNIETKNINEFNVKFENYCKKNILTAQDVITIGNLAKRYNEQSENIQVTVLVAGVESKYNRIYNLTDELSYEFIKQYSNENNAIFECQSIHYNETTGKIDKIQLKKH